MSSRFRISLAMLLSLAACEREERQDRPQPLPQTAPIARADPRGAQYQNNANQMARGQMLYKQMNCNGCHSAGGGGMGPALMDAEWRYGGTTSDIVDTILDGRPNGMPAWRGRLNEDQAWQLAAYVRSLSGQPNKDVVSSREDGIARDPLTLAPRQPVDHRGEYAETRPKQ